MQNKNWEQVKEILQHVLPLETEDRNRYLSDSGVAPEIRAEVESLLGFEEEAENLMHLSAVEFSRDFFDEDDKSTLIGQNIGVYKIVRELGQGGMGAVYLAERTDGKFSQRVALKLLKREMNTSALRRRFQQEREILASLEHPHIARLLDAGATGDKVPFIAMEYVEGLPIDDYCNKHRFDLNQRLDLFRKVCAAVNFAHRNLIVHRDLKPSNILVNDEGLPKLLDFGISKILSNELVPEDSATVTRLGVMTPSYASPEQLQSKSVTTATDIYSLGVILYELLSGHRPFESKESDLKEIYKAVIETDPLPPSAIISTIGKQLKEITEAKTAVKAENPRESATVISNSDAETEAHKMRYTIPRTVNLSSQNLRGDLDNIVLKTLRKEPERRYTSAENLAEDIHRHQRGLPVTARANTFSYRTEKFIKRNKASVIGAFLLVLAIIGGLITTLWQARVAQAERAKAEKRFNDVRTLANSFLFEFGPKIENLSGSMPARQLLVTRALEYLDNLSQEAGNDSKLQNELATAYEKVGDVQGNPQTPNIGDLKGALISYEKAQTIRRRLLETDSENAEKQADLAGNLEVTANINLNGGEFDKAEASLAEAVALREKVVAKNPKDVAARSKLGYAVRVSSYVPFYNSQNEKSLELSRRSLAIFEELSKDAPDDIFVNMHHANIYLDIGEGFAYMDDMAQGQENVQKGLDMLDALYKKYPNDTRVRRSLFVALLKRGELYRDAGDLPNSLEKYKRAFELSKLALQSEPGSFQAKRDVVLVNKQRAVTQKAAEKYKESLESFARAIEISEQLKREDPNNVIIIYDIGGSYHEMSELYYQLKDYQAALNAAQKTQENCGEVLTKNPAHTQSKNVAARAKMLIGKVYMDQSEMDNQSNLRQKALENFRASLDIYNNLKTDGKFTPLDAKRVAELQAAISKAEGKPATN